jgi:hypothetical protein
MSQPICTPMVMSSRIPTLSPSSNHSWSQGGSASQPPTKAPTVDLLHSGNSSLFWGLLLTAAVVLLLLCALLSCCLLCFFARRRRDEEDAERREKRKFRRDQKSVLEDEPAESVDTADPADSITGADAEPVLTAPREERKSARSPGKRSRRHRLKMPQKLEDVVEFSPIAF